MKASLHFTVNKEEEKDLHAITKVLDFSTSSHDLPMFLVGKMTPSATYASISIGEHHSRWPTLRDKRDRQEEVGYPCDHDATYVFNPFTASCENAMTLSVPGVPASCEKFLHSSQLNFWSTESIFYQFSVFLKTLNTLCVCLQYKHPRSMKRVIRSDKPVTLLVLLWSHKCDFGAEPRSRIIATSAVKGLKM
jgi:hypothetical protein